MEIYMYPQRDPLANGPNQNPYRKKRSIQAILKVRHVFQRMAILCISLAKEKTVMEEEIYTKVQGGAMVNGQNLKSWDQWSTVIKMK